MYDSLSLTNGLETILILVRGVAGIKQIAFEVIAQD
jgi:hypothetical protein